MNIDAVLNRLAGDPAASLDLAELALHLARDEYANLDVEAHLSELAGMAHECRAYLRGGLEARVHGLCRYLFHEMGYRGNAREYYDPRNSYFNQVLERRMGIPITLSLLAMAVGTRAGLQVAGVGLPGHFVAKAMDGSAEVLFDPFHGGRRLEPAECERLVEKVTGVPFRATPDSLRPLPAGLMVLRMLNNLRAIYLHQRDYPRAIRVLGRLRQLSPGDPQLRRDLGVCLIHAGQPGRAIDHLAAYVDSSPDPAEAAAARQLLDRARADVSRWN